MSPRHQRGYSFVEILIVLMTLPVLFMIMDKMFREIALDLPKSSQIVIQHEHLLRCLESLEQDLADAVALPQTHGTWQQNEDTLLIQLPDTLVAYVHKETGFVRRIIEPNTPDYEQSWPASLASLQWIVLPDNVTPNRVQVNTSVLHTHRKKQQLKNTHLFFVGVDRYQGELQ